MYGTECGESAGVRVEQQQQRRSLVLWGSGERPADVLYGTASWWTATKLPDETDLCGGVLLPTWLTPRTRRRSLVDPAGEERRGKGSKETQHADW